MQAEGYGSAIHLRTLAGRRNAGPEDIVGLRSLLRAGHDPPPEFYFSEANMTEQQEKDLRIHLATMCMAVKSSSGDLRVATDAVIAYVNRLLGSQ